MLLIILNKLVQFRVAKFSTIQFLLTVTAR
jgi:hypothetical protein